ncbi:MAG: elongation factor G [Dehalococcoidia bacterium]|nr:elongation factor G [Chloroflexota bacterium]
MSNRLPIKQIRNIGFIAHIDAGKTTVTERALYVTGRTYKIGQVDLGTAVMDWMPQERERGITITAAATTTTWKDHQINVIDTPGHVDFTAEVERSLRVLDGGVVVLDAVAGVQPQSETVWRQADKYHVPRICFVNKMDRVGADFERTLQSVRRRLKANALAIQMPMGQEAAFHGIMDLMGEKAYFYENGAESFEEGPVPRERLEDFQKYRDAMIEQIVETEERLMIRYLEGEDIPTEDLRNALRRATITRQLVPVLCGSALKTYGIQPLLDAVIDYLPSPVDVPPVEGIIPNSDEVTIRNADEDGPLAALAMKVATDPYVGRLVYLRVYSGVMKTGATVYNATKGRRERLGRVLQMHANHREEVPEITAGNIAAAIGLKDTFTGDTICDESSPIILEPPTFPSPVISVAIEPITQADRDKLIDSMRKLAEEDPTFLVRHDEETGQTIISGMGELHLEVLIDRLRREFGVGANVGKPKVSYRETITKPATAEGRFVRQTGGHGQFGDVWLEIEPLERGSGLVFESRIRGGVIPREFIRPVEQGVKQAAENGSIAGYRVVDLKVTLVDGSYHPVDSSELAFRAAGSLAFREAFRKGQPVLLEPIMEMEVVTPAEFLGAVLGDLNSRRAQIQTIEGGDDIQQVRVLVPLSESFGYATGLRSMTQGRATHTMEFKYYEPVPQNFVKDIVLGG